MYMCHLKIKAPSNTEFYQEAAITGLSVTSNMNSLDAVLALLCYINNYSLSSLRIFLVFMNFAMCSHRIAHQKGSLAF